MGQSDLYYVVESLRHMYSEQTNKNISPRGLYNLLWPKDNIFLQSLRDYLLPEASKVRNG